jgi:hypothetical protein
MSAEDYIYFDFGPDSQEDNEPEPYTKTCKYCGTRSLMWEQIESKWRLFNEKHEQHICKGRP